MNVIPKIGNGSNILVRLKIRWLCRVYSEFKISPFP